MFTNVTEQKGGRKVYSNYFAVGITAASHSIWLNLIILDDTLWDKYSGTVTK